MMYRRLMLICLLVAFTGFQLGPLFTHTPTVRASHGSQEQGEDLQTTGPDFTRLVFVGDSLTAGFQSAQLSETGQLSGYANLLAKQVEKDVNLPLIANPGLIPNSLLSLNKGICQSPFPIGYLNLAPVQGSGSRKNPMVQTSNLAVPGMTVSEALSLKAAPLADPTKATLEQLGAFVILGLPGLLATPPIGRSQMEWAKELKPTTLVIWIGNNDALGAVLAGTDKELTPLTTFTSQYTALLKAAKETGAKDIFVANIPDVTSIPILLSQDDLTKISGQNKETIQFIFGVEKKDFVLPTALSLLPKGQKLPDNQVLTKKEIKKIKQAVTDYNSVIAAQATANGATLVDMNKFFLSVAANGVTIDGVGKVTARPFGGAFSLDFLHPSATGYGIAANEFIRVINTKGGKVPSVDLKAIASADPLVCKPSGAADEIMFVEPFTAQQLENLMPQFERTIQLFGRGRNTAGTENNH